MTYAQMEFKSWLNVLKKLNRGLYRNSYGVSAKQICIWNCLKASKIVFER